jgi:hypothetical protein
MDGNDFKELSAENREHRLAHQTLEEMPIEHARNAADEMREMGFKTTLRKPSLEQEIDGMLLE